MHATAVVIGSTGLVGTELVKRLLATSFYSSVLLLNRRPSQHVHPKISERIIDFDEPNLSGVSGEHLFCALGTTLHKAGSKSAQFRIDCEYPTTIATLLKKQGTRSMILVSSVGANAKAANFYTRTKGQLEQNIIALGFENTVICRPSFLIGTRSESRTAENAALAMLNVVSPFMIGGLSRYRGIEASRVAECMVREATGGVSGVRFLEFDEMQGAEGYR